MTRPCPGCLDSGECWICLGTGALDTEKGIGVCGSCGGSRHCAYCGDEAADRERGAA